MEASELTEKVELEEDGLSELMGTSISKWVSPFEPVRSTARRRCRFRCECGGSVACDARSPRAKRGFRRRPHHDLCRRCYRALLDSLIGSRLAVPPLFRSFPLDIRRKTRD